MSKYSRTKGHNFERQIAQEFREIGFPDATTTRNTRGGNWALSDDGIDLWGTDKYIVQCKNMKSYCSVNTIEEIKIVLKQDDWDSEAVPLVITKANNKEPMAILPWSALKELLRYEAPITDATPSGINLNMDTRWAWLLENATTPKELRELERYNKKYA